MQSHTTTATAAAPSNPTKHGPAHSPLSPISSSQRQHCGDRQQWQRQQHANRDQRPARSPHCSIRMGQAASPVFLEVDRIEVVGEVSAWSEGRCTCQHGRPGSDSKLHSLPRAGPGSCQSAASQACHATMSCGSKQRWLQSSTRSPQQAQAFATLNTADCGSLGISCCGMTTR